MRVIRPSSQRSALRRWVCTALVRLVVALALMLVFLAYVNPHLTVDLATRLWSCF